MSPFEAFQHAVAKAGGQTKFGALHGASQQRIWNLLNLQKPMPAEWVLATEAATGIPRHIIRPDIYPPPEEEGRRVANGA